MEIYNKMAFGDVYIMRVSGTYFGQEVMAVYNWKHVAGEAAANALTWRATFESDIMPSLQAITNDELTYTQIETINWRDPTDFDIVSVGYSGDIDSTENEPLSPWLTNLYRLNRNAPGQAHGFKRYAGGVESQFESGEPDAAFATVMAAHATALGAGLTATFDRLARYWVVDSTTDPELGANPAGYAVQTALYRGLGTQKSRKS